MSASELDCATLVKPSFGFYVGLLGLLHAWESTKIVFLSLASYLGRKISAWPAIHAKYSQFIICLSGAAVFAINLLIAKPKVRPSIVAWLTIYVINPKQWPFSGHVKPRKPMGINWLRVNRNAHVSIPFGVPEDSAGLPLQSTARINEACKHSGFGFVVKKFAQTLRGKISLSHDALLLLIGQRPASVDALGGLRHFKGVAA